MAALLKKYSVCILLLCLAGTARAETWQAVCTSVIDGDSLMVTGAGVKKEIRLYGIDAPEFDQPYGRQARACTRDLVLQKKVTVEPREIDAYGRTVAKVHTSEGCLNEQLLEQGCAWVYKRYCKSNDLKVWTAHEESARQQGLGLWAQPDPVAPWNFRRSRRSVEKKQANNPGAVLGYYRGNTGSFVFHAPGCTYYNCKNCTAGFNSIGAAMRAGYKPCKHCIDR